MQLIVNGKEFKLETSKTLISFLEQQHLLNTKGIAIAVNNTVVPKNNWNNYELKNNDSITIIRATQGG